MRLRPMLAVLARAQTDPGLARYQLSAFAKQMPVLYGILLVNALGLAATHMGTAPPLLTAVLPAILGALCLVRLAHWARSGKSVLTDQQALRRVRATTPLAGFLGASFTVWSLSLYPYGDVYAQVHVAYYMSVTLISCMLCLTHMRRASLLLAVIVIGPFTVFFCSTGEPVLIAMSVNFLLVAAGTVFVMMRNYDDFTAMIIAQRELLTRQTETERLHADNLRLANLDGLTLLPNRRSFLLRLDEVLAEAGRDMRRFAVAIIDLDGFRRVNDVCGHAAGDVLLAEVGTRLAAASSDGAPFAARLGGDEFAVIFQHLDEGADVGLLGDRLCAWLHGPYLMPDIAAEVTASVGLVAYPEGGQTSQQLFERAEYALHHGKQHGVGKAVMFSQEHETLIRNAGRVEQALRHADLETELRPLFQPIVDAATGWTIGFEALVRWHSPVLGAVPPDAFIPIAERTQMIGRITEVVLAKALAAARDWPDHLRISVNLSARDLISPSTVAAIRRIIVGGGVAPARIDLEITETAVMRDFAQASDSLAMLRQLGLRISLDDFGTGYSSLSHVHRLRLDKIKIDRSFVVEIHASQTACDIVKTIVDLCRNLNLDCVVEGVETEAQKRRLMALGCRYMQGYLFSRPIAQSAVTEYVRAEAEQLRAVV